MPSDQHGGEDHQDEWDARWTRIREMEAGPHDPYTDFREVVNSAMEDLANDVGRPLVMKVSVRVKGGKLNRTGVDEDE